MGKILPEPLKKVGGTNALYRSRPGVALDGSMPSALGVFTKGKTTLVFSCLFSIFFTFLQQSFLLKAHFASGEVAL